MENHIFMRGKKIHYGDQGKGDTIILVHGYLETSEVWRSFEKKLSGKFRVITPDLPGHGLSELPSGKDSLEFFASVIKDLIDKLGPEKVFLVGHSLGGYITLAFLELYPGKLNGYCLFHSHPLADSPEAIEKRDREIKMISEGRKDQMFPDIIRRLFATFNLEKFSEAVNRSLKIASGVSDEGIIKVLKAMKARPQRAHLIENGDVPGLWILGKYDNLISCETIQQKVTLPSNLEVVVLQNSGHMGFIEEENNSLNILSGFVEKLKK